MKKVILLAVSILDYPIINSSDFHPSSTPQGKATEVNTAIRRLVGRTSVLPTDKEKPMSLAKRKRRPVSVDIMPTPPQAFGNKKP